MEATGGSGLLSRAAAEVAGMPVRKVHHHDSYRPLRNLALGVPGPGSVPAGLSIEPPHDPAHALRADPLAVWSDQVSAALLPTQPVRAQIGMTVDKDPSEGLSARAGPFRNQLSDALKSPHP